MRIQGCHISDKEIIEMVDSKKKKITLEYDIGVFEEIERQAEIVAKIAE